MIEEVKLAFVTLKDLLPEIHWLVGILLGKFQTFDFIGLPNQRDINYLTYT